MEASPLLSECMFWSETLIEFLELEQEEEYPVLMAAPGNFFFELYHLCALVVCRQLRHSVGKQGYPTVLAKAHDYIKGVFEVFENEPTALNFFASIFPDVTQRSRDCIEDFDAFMIGDLADVAQLGVEVLNRVQGMELAIKALTALYVRYLRKEPPPQWKVRHQLSPSPSLSSSVLLSPLRSSPAHPPGSPTPPVSAQALFKEAARTAYNLKYMFRESLPMAKKKFVENLDRNLEGKPRELFEELVHGAFDIYQGLVDQETLATTDFLTNPQALVKVVLDGVAGGDARVKLLGEIAAKYMRTYIENDQLPLTPHHTQICAMLIFSQFFEQRARCAEAGLQAVILQMKTGEGKSIVIAMMAIYTARLAPRRRCARCPHRPCPRLTPLARALRRSSASRSACTSSRTTRACSSATSPTTRPSTAASASRAPSRSTRPPTSVTASRSRTTPSSTSASCAATSTCRRRS